MTPEPRESHAHGVCVSGFSSDGSSPHAARPRPSGVCSRLAGGPQREWLETEGGYLREEGAPGGGAPMSPR